MIRIHFKLTWPLALLILIAVAAWLLRHARQAQAQPATRPINYAHVVNVPPPADGPQSAGDPLEQILRDGEEAVRTAAHRPNEFTTARQQREERRRARHEHPQAS